MVTIKNYTKLDYHKHTVVSYAEETVENEQEALLKAQDMYRNEEVVLYPDDFIDTKFNIFKYG